MCDNGIAMCLHIGGAFGLLNRPKTAGADHLIVLSPQLSAVTAADLMTNGTFLRFPDLKVALSEGGIGWIPFFLDRMDRHMWNHRWTGLEVAKGKTPTELFRSNFLGCFITDPSSLHVRDRIGDRRDRLGVRLPPLRLDLAPLARAALGRAPGRRLQRRRHRRDHVAERLPLLPLRPVRGHAPRARRRSAGLRARATDVDVSETSKAEYRRAVGRRPRGGLSR